jgi:hypothetical protein
LDSPSPTRWERGPGGEGQTRPNLTSQMASHGSVEHPRLFRVERAQFVHRIGESVYRVQRVTKIVRDLPDQGRAVLEQNGGMLAERPS